MSSNKYRIYFDIMTTRNGELFPYIKVARLELYKYNNSYDLLLYNIRASNFEVDNDWQIKELPENKVLKKSFNTYQELRVFLNQYKLQIKQITDLQSWKDRFKKLWQ